MKRKIKPMIFVPLLTLLEWKGNIMRLVFCAGLCRIHLAPFQSHLVYQSYHDPGCFLQVSNSLCLKSIPTVFVTFSIVGRTHTVRAPWFNRKVPCFVQAKGFPAQVHWAYPTARLPESQVCQQCSKQTEPHSIQSSAVPLLSSKNQWPPTVPSLFC